MNAPVIPLDGDDGRRTIVEMIDPNTAGLLAGGLVIALVVLAFVGVMLMLGAFVKDSKP